MKFETKYIFRWGIPGWIFMTLLSIAAFATIDPLYAYIIKNLDITKVLSILVTLFSLGVPVGYLFHQIYFSWDWSNKQKFLGMIPLRNDKTLKPIKDAIGTTPPGLSTWSNNFTTDYYYIEFLWDKLLMSTKEEKRGFILNRYKHFLSTIHGLGSLLYSLVTGVFFTIILWVYVGWNEQDSIIFIILLAIQGFLINSTAKNYRYFSDNLIHYQAYFLKELLDEESQPAQVEPPKVTEHKISIKFENEI